MTRINRDDRPGDAAARPEGPPDRTPPRDPDRAPHPRAREDRPDRLTPPHPATDNGEPNAVPPADAIGADAAAPEAFGAGVNRTAPEAFGRTAEQKRRGGPVADRDRPRDDRKDQPARRRPADPDEGRADDGEDDADEEDEADDADADGHTAADEKDDAKGARPDEPRKPPFYKRPVPMIIIGAVLLAAIVGGVLWYLHARQYESTDDAFIDGHIIPISPDVSAYVAKVHIDDNVHVKAGDVMVELDPRDFQVIVQQMQANLESARYKLQQAQTQLDVANANVGESQAEVTVAQTNYDNAKRDYDRFTALDPRARSQQQLDNATAALKGNQAQVEQAKAKLAASQASVADAQVAVKTAQAAVERAQADLDQAKINLGYCTITAPEDGYVTRKNVEPGAYVSKGQALCSIVPTNVWVTANYKETQLDPMAVGQHVTISVDAYPDRDFNGTVNSIQHGTGARFSLLPPENATGNYVKVVQRVPVKITFDGGQTDDVNHPLAPGMSVTPKVKVR